MAFLDLGKQHPFHRGDVLVYHQQAVAADKEVAILVPEELPEQDLFGVVVAEDDLEHQVLDHLVVVSELANSANQLLEEEVQHFHFNARRDDCHEILHLVLHFDLRLVPNEARSDFILHVFRQLELYNLSVDCGDFVLKRLFGFAHGGQYDSQLTEDICIDDGTHKDATGSQNGLKLVPGLNVDSQQGKHSHLDTDQVPRDSVCLWRIVVVPDLLQMYLVSRYPLLRLLDKYPPNARVKVDVDRQKSDELDESERLFHVFVYV